ncbi:MAG TPA: hypothetical protein VMU21_11530 [Thermodesulfovibrionales bacterium]|nr:hypothetical protein [Thermodesulfovibrionales bacterium]
MAWSPKYIDKPLRFLYDPEVWGVSFIAMGILMLFGLNQTLSAAMMIPIGAVVQRTVDHHKPGFLPHIFYRAGMLDIFCPYGKYRF